MTDAQARARALQLETERLIQQTAAIESFADIQKLSIAMVLHIRALSAEVARLSREQALPVEDEARLRWWTLLLQSVAQAAADLERDGYFVGGTYVKHVGEHGIITAQVTALATTQREAAGDDPVAWKWRFKEANEEWRLTFDHPKPLVSRLPKLVGDSLEVEPLYARAPAAAQAPAKIPKS